MAQKSWLYLNHRPQGQMHYLILNSKICEVAHSAHRNSPQPTFPSCHGPDMNPNSPWRREEEVGGLGSLLPTINSPSEHTCFTDVNIYLIVHPNTWITWWQLEPGVPTESLVANWTELSAVFGEASWTNRQIFFFPLKTKIIEEKKTKLDKARIRWDWFLLFCWGSLWSHSPALMMG